MKTQRKMNAFAQGVMIKHMLEGVYTCQELAELTGLHYITVLHYARELHRAGACHISSWEKDIRGRDVIKVYKIGVGKDAKREKMTDVERQARSRSKRQHLALVQRMAA